MDAKQACESQAEYAPKPSNSTGLEMPARDCCEGLPVGDAGDYMNPLEVEVRAAVEEAWSDAKLAMRKSLERVNCKASLKSSLPTSPAERKAIPLCTGLLDYFPKALAAVAECSRVGNDQHNPGQPLHWSREKSADHADCLVRHLVERGTVDTDGVRHSAKAAWRCLALLELEIEAGKS